MTALLGVITLATGHVVTAETHALLVGVSGYPLLPEQRRLSGPANDVLLMRDALQKSGVPYDHITLLADKVPVSKALPTRANILEALATFTRSAKRNDWVVVYFSGHGSQQPQFYAGKGYREPDGLDEIFLPYDVSSWDGKIGKVAGALVDDEIGVAFDAITKRGIHLWAIFDTCHAGDMAKGGRLFNVEVEDAPMWRHVAPSELGVPHELMSQARQANRARIVFAKTNSKRLAKAVAKTGVTPKPEDGQLVAFYSSQSNEPSAEESLPDLLSDISGGSGKKRRFGAFTWHLAQAIPKWEGSYQSLAAMIEQNYRNVRPFPTPAFEGALQITPQFRQREKDKSGMP